MRPYLSAFIHPSALQKGDMTNGKKYPGSAREAGMFRVGESQKWHYGVGDFRNLQHIT